MSAEPADGESSIRVGENVAHDEEEVVQEAGAEFTLIERGGCGEVWYSFVLSPGFIVSSVSYLSILVMTLPMVLIPGLSITSISFCRFSLLASRRLRLPVRLWSLALSIP